jgi:hypothetical protein
MTVAGFGSVLEVSLATAVERGGTITAAPA